MLQKVDWMKRNIIFFYMYRISSRLYFHLAVLFVYFYINHIEIMKIELFLAVYGIMLMVSSQWNAKLTNYISEKYVIALGELIKATGLFFLTLKFNFWLLLVGQVLSGIGYSLTAGTDSSLLRTLLSETNFDKYKKVESSSNSIMFIAFLFAGITGSILFSFNESSVFYVSMIANLVAILAILSIRVSKDKKHTQLVGEPEHKNKNQHSSLEKSSLQGFWVTYYALSRAFPLAIFVGFLPYFLFVDIKINLYFFGFILSLFTFAGFLAARLLASLSTRFDYKVITITSMSLSIISMLLLGLIDNVYISTIVVFLLGLSSGGVRPLVVVHLKTGQLESKERISLFSSMERLYGFWNASLLVVGGLLFNLIGFQYLMILFASLYTVLIFIFIKKYNFNFKENTSINSISKGESL